MKTVTQNTFVATGLVAAALAVCLLPQRGQTQDSDSNPTARIRVRSGDQIELTAPIAPVVPVAPVAPVAPAVPDVRRRESDDRLMPNLKDLRDKILKEVEETLRKELKENFPSDRRNFEAKIQSEIEEKLAPHRRKLEAQRQAHDAQRRAHDAERQELDAHRRDFEVRFQHDGKVLTTPNISVDLFRHQRFESDDLKQRISQSDQQLERNTRALLATFSNHPDSNRQEFAEKLTKLVSEHFDIKQAARERELKQLEEQLTKLRALNDQRMKEKKEIIQDRVRSLTREAAGLGWGSGRSNPDLINPEDINEIIDNIEEGNDDDNQGK